MKWCVKSEVRRLFEKQRDYLNRAKGAKKSVSATITGPKHLQTENFIKNTRSSLSEPEVQNVENILESSNSEVIKKVKTESKFIDESDSECNLVMVDDYDDALNESKPATVSCSLISVKLEPQENVSNSKVDKKKGGNDLLGDILSSMGLSEISQNANKGIF